MKRKVSSGASEMGNREVAATATVLGIELSRIGGPGAPPPLLSLSISFSVYLSFARFREC